ncbi:hypothetical protein U2F26_17135 [Micromonospora sp. 4G57]|uniref:Uncharacterized protein n=1 Tax=Micromonospora sicca TaxID=2202420 RepID=A0ABU5JAW0_9ACTN|nr:MULTISPECIES: hypothetical protein [unclassified Micromonospora]MDZ5444444.1 hypothetical protein [Micromonospora sp. 4G57]MDZ5489722.1 hypothetical protein [Micromonospora sp. 4G53]
MPRRRNSTARPALILAFAAGALTGAASALTLRRRRQEGGIPPSDVADQLGETAVPSLGGPFDGPAQESMTTPAVQHG